MNARIWGGGHYRFATIVGRELGRQVTEHANDLQPASWQEPPVGSRAKRKRPHPTVRWAS